MDIISVNPIGATAYLTSSSSVDVYVDSVLCGGGDLTVSGGVTLHVGGLIGKDDNGYQYGELVYASRGLYVQDDASLLAKDPSLYQKSKQVSGACIVKCETLRLNTTGAFKVGLYDTHPESGMAAALSLGGSVYLTKCDNGFELYSNNGYSNLIALFGDAEEDGYDVGEEYNAEITSEGNKLTMVISVPVASYDAVISFNANGGSGEMEDRYSVFRNDYSLPTCEFTAPSGQQFKCWAEGSADGDRYNAGAAYNLTEDVTFYAIWEDKAPVVANLTFQYYDFNTSQFQSFKPNSTEGYSYSEGVLTISHGASVYILKAMGGDLTVVFEDDYGRNLNYAQDYGEIDVLDGALTLISDDSVNVYLYGACCMDGDLTVSGGVNLQLFGNPMSLYYANTEAVLYASGGILVLDDASVIAKDGDWVAQGYPAAMCIAKCETLHLNTTGAFKVGLYDTSAGTILAHALGITGPIFLGRCDGGFELYRNAANREYIYGTGWAEDYNISDEFVTEITPEGSKGTMVITLPVLSFDANGGSGEMEPRNSSKRDDYTLPPCAFQAPENKQFKCWAEGSVDGDQYDAGATYNLCGDVTFFAIWEAADLSGSLTIEGNLQYGETLTASVTDCNNIGELSYQWLRDEVAIAGANQATYTLVEADIGAIMSVEVTCDGQGGSLYGTFDVTVDRADGPQAPTGLTATACTTSDNNDGTIGGVTTAMEYSADQETWTAVSGETITGLANGTYYVRYKATTTHKVGVSTPLTIAAYVAPTYYTITVYSGTANVTTATAGTTITLTADDPEIGYIFGIWTSDDVTFADETSATTTFVMPEGNVTVSANYDNMLYTITVVRGTSSSIEAAMDVIVTITADKPETGYVFDRWTSDDVTFANATSATTTFDMPAGNVTVTANYKIVQYTVSFNANGGNGVKEAEKLNYGTVYTLPTSASPIAAPDGKEFDGWALTASGVKITEKTITLTADVELFARWIDVAHVHTMQSTAASSATCTTDGNIAYWYCTACEKYFADANGLTEIALKDTVVVALDHDWGEWTVTTPATCESAGVETRTCSRDSTHVETRSITALGHDWGEWIVVTPATETTDGYEICTCSRDSTHVKGRTIPSIGHVHNLQAIVAKSATCTTAGNIAYYECIGCHRLFSDKLATNEIEIESVVIAPLDHDWGEWTVTTPAQVGIAGVETRICSRDASHIETRPIDALAYPHREDDGVNVYEAKIAERIDNDVANLFDQAQAENGKVEITAGSLKLTFDAAAVKAISGGVVSISANVLTSNFGIDGLDGIQSVIEISFTGATFANGKVLVELPFETVIPEGKIAKVYYVNGNERTDMNAVFANGKLSFTTNHFSKFAVVLEGGQTTPVDPDPEVEPVVEPKPEKEEVAPEKEGLTGGAIAAIVIAVVVALAGTGVGVFFLLKKKGILGGNQTNEPKNDDKSNNPPTDETKDDPKDDDKDETQIELKDEPKDETKDEKNDK